MEELGGGLAVTLPGTVARPVGAGAALLARIGGGTPSWIFFNMAETKLASVNGERSSGFSRYFEVSLASCRTQLRQGVFAQVRSTSETIKCGDPAEEDMGSGKENTHTLDGIIRRLHARTLPDDLVGAERMEHPRVEDSEDDCIDAHEQTGQDEERMRHHAHAHVQLRATVVVQLVFVQGHVVVEEDSVQDWVLAGEELQWDRVRGGGLESLRG